MLLHGYGFRNRFKERLCQIRDTVEYATHHPYTGLKDRAFETTLEFIAQNCPHAVPFRSPRALMDNALAHVKEPGLLLEFGVWRGGSIRHIAKRFPGRQVHGFDSFEGLPEDWAANAKGTFSTQGRLPKVPENVTLHKGWFDDTVPQWKQQHSESVAFMHVDCDLYSSTKTIFDELEERLKPGSVIVFDDYFNFPNWEQDGHRVLTDMIAQSKLKVDYLGYAFKEVAVILV